MSGSGPGRLHVLTDETLQARFTHLDLARFAAEGGADTVQFREKRDLSTARRVDVACSIVEVLRPAGVRLVVNDRTDVAVAAGADGVHLGRHDLDPAWARRILGAGGLIGATANDRPEALARSGQPVDYVGVGPVFGTRSKASPAPTLGLDLLESIARGLGRPVIAIGGITPERVGEVMAAGAFGIAVLSDVACAVDPAKRVAEFREAIEEGVGDGDRRARIG